MRWVRIGLLFWLAVAAAGSPVFGCSMVTIPPITHQLEDMVPISGVVKSYLSQTGILPGEVEVHGLLVEAREGFGRATAGETVQVLLLGVDPACDDIPRDLELVHEQYPIGAMVTFLGQVDDVGRPNLFTSGSEDFGHVARLPAKVPRLENGILDFFAFSELYEEHPSDSYSIEVAWRNSHRGWFEDYEYMRALTDLAGADREEKKGMAENIIAYSGWRHMNSEHALKRFRAFLKIYKVPRKDRRFLRDRFKETRKK